MQRRKPLREKRKKGKNKLMYAIVAVTLIFIFFLAYSLLPKNPSSNNHTSPPKAALIDHLSFSSPPPNETFKALCKTILKNAGFSYTYHGGEEVTVDFYKKLPTYGYSLMILRVHSAVIEYEGNRTDLIGLFTSTPCNNITMSKYSFEINEGRLAQAQLLKENDTYYFGITPLFVQSDSMIGNFKDTVIIMMGCEGLNRTTMADAFVHWKKAKVYISWTGPVTVSHTDDATIRLLQSLLQQNQTIKAAVDGISHDPVWTWSRLDYYPKDVGNKVLQDFISGLTIKITGMSGVCYKVCLLSSSKRFEAMK